jgi:hypothetical protein
MCRSYASIYYNGAIHNDIDTGDNAVLNVKYLGIIEVIAECTGERHYTVST